MYDALRSRRSYKEPFTYEESLRIISEGAGSHFDPDVYAGRRPAALSGGQAQRVGVARALAAEPEVVLFDEPFGALDPLTRESVQASFTALRAELGLTGVFVTHDIVAALTLGDRIAVMRDGRVVEVDTPDALRGSDEPYVRELLEAPRRALEALR